MYILEEVNKCEICKKTFKSGRGLGKHVQQQFDNNPTGLHPKLEEYKRLYHPPGYVNGIPPNDRKIYMLCDPLNPGIYNYGNINLFGEIIDIIFECEPFYCGYGKMKERAKYSAAHDDTNNPYRKIRIIGINEAGLKPIIYIVKENITIQQGKEGEKILIPLIGRQNHPDPDRRGPLLNRNNGGDGYASGELSQEVRDQMSESRSGNKNRCDTWKLTRIDDGYVMITKDLRKTCEEFGLNIKCIHQITAGKQKSHRGWTAENLTKKISKNLK